MSKGSAGAVFSGITLDEQADLPLYRQIYLALRQPMLDGSLPPGSRMPSTRTLAKDLGVARNTVVVAYDLLAAEDFIESRVGAGAVVRADARRKGPVGGRGTDSPVTRPQSQPSKRAATTKAALGHVMEGKNLRMAFGVPDISAFPAHLWQGIIGRTRQTQAGWGLESGDLLGLKNLRRAIASHLAVSRGTVCDPAQVIITSGTHRSLDFALKVTTDPGDRVWVENPGYKYAYGAMASAGVKTIPVPVDADGLDVKAGVALDPHARAAYVTPSHQFPLGMTMALRRRVDLLAWAEREGAWVYEDDYDSDYRYAGRPLAALQGLDRAGRVIYMGTFNKAMFPGLRLAFMIVPEALVDAFATVISATDGAPPPFMQNVLAQFIEEGHLESHLRRMRTLYAARYAHALEAVAARVPEATFLPSGAGMHVTLRLPAETDDKTLSAQLLQAGYMMPPLSSYCFAPRRQAGLMLPFAGVPETVTDAALDALARLLRH
ncbi:PLP-dependent aminotransferase family protein [Kordiimonas marina]|uniref:MocR-like pyridoxine biosynthesis transcription factor PdxR n=1 Tax=Kordiimonas marina TaxID=2872312 RepID=UPI001FF11BD0|nr:PLP-dependent aminotransferase family protein [Kordiimonas marina]MCJ9428640.1 PLP-dependent aminotransferase family protein [Kordiimonas marina]